VAQLLIPHSLEARARPRLDAVVEMISPAPRDIWRGVLRDDPGATALQTPEYLDAVVTGTGATDASRFYQLREGRQLVLPLVRRRSALGRHRDDGYPGEYGDGGMLATGGLLTDDVRAVLQNLSGESLRLWIRGIHQTGEQWSAGALPGVTEQRRRVEVLDLGSRSVGDLDAIRTTRLTEEARELRRRAAGLGVEVEQDTTGRLIPVVDDIYRARRRARRAEPDLRIADVAARMGRACRVFVAWRCGRPVAASIMLVHGQHATVWHTIGVGEPAAPAGTDLLLRATAIEDAARSGCRDIGLGPAGDGPDLSGRTGLIGAAFRSVVDLRMEPAGLARLRAARARAEGVLERAPACPPASPTLGQPMPR
jgi:Acetyltransferase (GNAT) domain